MADTYTEQNDLNAGSTGDGAYTLAQAALLEKDVLKKGVIETIVDENPVFQRLPYMPMEGNSLMYDYEVELPGVGFRSVNEGYPSKHGRVAQRAVGLTIFGGDLDVDNFIIKTRSSVNDQRAIQEAMQLKAMSLTWLKTFFDGDRSSSGNEEFDGVNLLLADTYHTSSGAASLDMVDTPQANGYDADVDLVDSLDEALDDVIGNNGNKVILMNKTARRWLTKLTRADGQISIERDAWGYQTRHYDGVPIVEIEDDGEQNAILGFDETCGTSDVTASIYVARFEPGYIQGIENGGMNVTDLGELQEKPAMRTRVEWYQAIALMHPRGLKRIKGLLQYT